MYQLSWLDKTKTRGLALCFLAIWPFALVADYLHVFLCAGAGAVRSLWVGEESYDTHLSIWASGPEYRQAFIDFCRALVTGVRPYGNPAGRGD
jgi:hypothetical protein